MLDFSKIFNIVFVSVCAGLLLLLLVSVIAVAAKGKRKCGAFDVFLRIVSSLVLVASAVMVACSVLTMLNTVDGSMCIVTAQEGDVAAAWIVMGGEITELPLPELFVALSTVIGFGLSAILFILSLTALIVDCLVANKKDGKKGEGKSKQEHAVKKTPEQIKREKELERIRRIGESAVRKTSSVASAEKAEAHAAETENNSEQPAPQAPEESAKQATDEQSDFDWRTSPEPEQEQAGFVGIKDEGDSFDSFDSFDDMPEQQAEAQQAADVDYGEEITDQAEEAAEEQAYDVDEPDVAEEAVEETEQVYYDDDEQYTLDDTAQEYDEQAEYYDENAPEQDDENLAQTEEEVYEDEGEAQTEEVYEDEPVTEQQETYDQPAPDADTSANDEQPARESLDIEPDRGIYIPKIRTVTPQQKPEVKKASAKADKKPTAKKSTSKTSKPKKSGGGEQKPSVATNIPPEKKLPVTRRYVILDRHNAVNMFGEYLKERNQAEKDKLKSSINTIIIE